MVIQVMTGAMSRYAHRVYGLICEELDVSLAMIVSAIAIASGASAGPRVTLCSFLSVTLAERG